MNKDLIVGSKATCAHCGSQLSSSADTEELCVNCLLRTALSEEDVDHPVKPLRFDQYELIIGDDGAPVELGRGAMGVTYKAFDTNLRCEVALKVIHPHYLADERSRARFLSEARAAAQLRHRNIASVFHLGSELGEYFYAMELVEGETIEDRVRRNGPIDCSTALDITLQITRALVAAGDRKFVHRDVKPSNVMLCTEADGAILAKLIDFGLVRAVTDQSASASGNPVRTGFIGTPHFASPEQFVGQATDGRSDIYSLGVTLWFMLTGALPFDGTREQIQRQQLSGVLPRDQLKGIPRAVVDLIRRMLDVDPVKRPQSPTALKEQLGKCIAAVDAAKQKQRRRFAYGALAAATLIIAALGASSILQRKLMPSGRSDVAPEKSIAVLPFENLSHDADDAYFAEGIQDEILTRLAKIADLKVISRTSTQRYRSKPGNLTQIASQLGVANIVEGSVQKVANQVRVNVQLINAQTDSHLWAETYDRELTDILGVEGEIAKRIAESLQARLSGHEEQALTAKLTTNPEAYEAYLRGLASQERIAQSIYLALKTIGNFERAVELDPNFAVAWARLSRAHSYLYFQGIGIAHPDPAKEALENAQKLQPNSPETLLARGYYQYWVLHDYALAKTTFRRASDLLPNSSEVAWALSAVNRRLGNWKESVADIESGLARDPRNGELLMAAAWTYDMLRQFPTALRLYERALDIIPNDPDLMALVASALQAQGNLDEAAKFLSGITVTTPFEAAFAVNIVHLRLKREHDEAVRLLQARLTQYKFTSEIDKGSTQVSLAFAQRMAGDIAGAKVSAEQARNTVQPLCDKEPNNPTFAATLALAYAAVGEKDLALKEAERATVLLPNAKDAVGGPCFEENLALIQALFGENDRAIPTLRRLLQTPFQSWFYGQVPLTQAFLRLDPLWDPLRADSRFEEILGEPNRPGGLK